MSYKLKITVTQDHIDKGECANVSKCAIALAVRDIFPNAFVGSLTILPFPSYRDWLETIIKHDQGEFVNRFDNKNNNRKEFKPFTFEVDVPDEVIEHMDLDELNKVLQDHPTLELERISNTLLG